MALTGRIILDSTVDRLASGAKTSVYSIVDKLVSDIDRLDGGERHSG